jgi:uncharacterized FlgJ-related protein
MASVLLTICTNAISQHKYTKKFKPLVDSLSSVYEIPFSVIKGVSIIESGLGRDRNAKLLNNYFGFVGKNNLMKTHGIKTRDKQYNSAKASLVDFCEQVSKQSYYPNLRDNMQYDLWLNAMAKSGYSSKPDIWKKEVTSVIKKYKLEQLSFLINGLYSKPYSFCYTNYFFTVCHFSY